MEGKFRNRYEGGVGPCNEHICGLQGSSISGKGPEGGGERPGPERASQWLSFTEQCGWMVHCSQSSAMTHSSPVS